MHGGGGNSEARFVASGTLAIDQDGNGSEDIVVRVQGLTAASLLTATDFIWL